MAIGLGLGLGLGAPPRGGARTYEFVPLDNAAVVDIFDASDAASLDLTNVAEDPKKDPAEYVVDAWRSAAGDLEAKAATTERPAYDPENLAVVFDGVDDVLGWTAEEGQAFAGGLMAVVSNVAVGTGDSGAAALASDALAPGYGGVFPENDETDYTFAITPTYNKNIVGSVDGGTVADDSGATVTIAGYAPFPNETTKRIVYLKFCEGEWKASQIGKARNATGDGDVFGNLSIHELIVLGTTITAGNRQKLEGYLAHKWGLTANLPSDHPYKLVKPTA